MSIAVVTDSAADLPPAIAARNGIRVVPLTVAFGADALDDGTSLTADAFWDRIAEGSEPPTTASPPPASLTGAYRAAAEAGAEGVVSVHLSRSLSRTIETAAAAAGEAVVPVEVVDSGSVSLGEGLVALAAARTATGASLQDAAAAAREAAGRLEVYAALETVEFLRRGAARARTRSRAIAEVLERAAGPAEMAGVIHSRSPEVDAVVRAIRES